MPRAPKTTPDPVEQKIRELREYTDDDEDTSVNIVAQPGSHVHVNSDPEIAEDDIPLKKAPRWAKTVASVVGALVGLATLAKAIWQATR